MTAPTHSVFGMFLCALVFSFVSYPLFRDYTGMGLVLVGALLPDIDHPQSSMGRVFFFISQPLERAWGHRTVTHSLLALGAVALASSPLLFFSVVWWLCLSLGYLSHLLIDASNKSGVPLFWPSKSVCVFPYADRFRIATGSMKGEGVLLVILIVLLGMYMPVSNLGFYRAIRYLTGTQRSAYSDYRSASTQTLLKFKGLYASTRKPVEGTAPILEGDFYRFVLYIGGRPVTYGEQGEIIPLKSRVVISGEPIVVHKESIENAPFERLLVFPDSCLISGKLTSNYDFILESEAPTIRSDGRKLILEYASRADLLTVAIKRGVDPVALEQLKTDIDIAELEIRTFSQDLPRNKLKRLESRLASLDALRASLLARLSAVQDPLERITLREQLSRNETDRRRIESHISGIDLKDMTTAYKLKRASFQRDQLNLEFDELNEGGVLFSGNFSVRKL